MATCIKTLLLNAIKADLEGIAAVKSVVLNPIDLPKGDEEALRVSPFLVLVDFPEDNIKRENRLRVAEFLLHVYGFQHSTKASSISADLDELHAQVYSKMANKNCTFKEYCQGLWEVSHNKDTFDENSGQLEDVWRVRYCHAEGDPYTKNPT